MMGRPCCAVVRETLAGRPRCGGETLVGTLRVQKCRWARNSPFPLKNGLFLVYSTIADIRDKFYHFGPLWWGDPAVVGRPRCGGP